MSFQNCFEGKTHIEFHLFLHTFQVSRVIHKGRFQTKPLQNNNESCQKHSLEQNLIY